MAEQSAFAQASIELFSRLWAQLESMAAEGPLSEVPPDSALALRVQILRLELIVLLDACRATRWRMLLSGEQRRALELRLSEVLECLNTRFEEAPLPTIEGAQNCLLAAVLEQHRGVQHAQIIDQGFHRARA
jgi:hypothetical protein